MDNYELISSSLLPITIGMQHGSVLRPSLFLVYINDLPNSWDFDIILNVNVSVMICNDKNIKSLKITIEKNLKNL